jgi:hypothetical protein
VAPAELQQLLDSLSNSALNAAVFSQRDQEELESPHAAQMSSIHSAVPTTAAADQAPAVAQVQHSTLSNQQTVSCFQQDQLKQRMRMASAYMPPWQQQHDSRFSKNSMHASSSSDEGSSSGSKDSSSTAGPTSSSSASSGASAASAPADFLAAALLAMGSSLKAAQLTPAAITQQLDKHIVGQAVSICYAVYGRKICNRCPLRNFAMQLEPL